MAVCVCPAITPCASSRIAIVSALAPVSKLNESPAASIEEPDITSPSICDKSCIEALASGIIPLNEGLRPLIIDMHGLRVTTTSPSSDTVSSLSLICSIDNFAPPTMFFIFLTWVNSPAYA